MTPSENALLERLLAVDFPGSKEIREQVRSLQVRRVDSDGSLELTSDSGPDAPVVSRVPVEAQSVDLDGVPVHVLLHVVNGRVKELEIYKADGSHLLREIVPEQLQVTSFSSGGS